MRKHWIYAAALTTSLILVGCDNGGDDPAPPPPPPPPASLFSLVSQMFAATNETGVPSEINTLDLDVSDETPTLYDAFLI